MTKKQVLKITAFFLILLLLLAGAGYFFNNQNIANSLRIRGFRLEEENSLDVVLMGASDILRAYLPGRAYENHGFTSYQLAFQGGPISTWRLQLKEIMKTQKPQLILVEAHAVIYGDAEMYDNNARKVFDNVPLSGSKVKIIRDVAPASDWESLLFPLIKYHDNWRSADYCAEVVKQDLANHRRGYTLLRGAMMGTNIAAPNNKYMDLKGHDEPISLPPKCARYLRDFLAYCRALNVEVRLIRSPHRNRAEDSAYRYINEAGIIAREYGYDLINFEYFKDEIGIDYETDFSDDEHLNVYGALKFTDFMSNYLVENGLVTPGSHSEKVKAQWADTVKRTDQYVDLVKSVTVENWTQNISEYNVDFTQDPVKLNSNLVLDSVWE